MKQCWTKLVTICLVLGMLSAVSAKPGDPQPKFEDLQEKFLEIPPCPEGMDLLKKMLTVDDAGVREYAAWCIGDAGKPETFAWLVAHVDQEKDASVRAQCARSLGILKAEHATSALITRLADESELVRMDAAWALGEIKAARAVKALAKLVTSDADLKVSVEAAIALGKIGDPEAAKPLVECLARKDPVLRLAALRALGGLKGPGDEAVGALVTNLASQSTAERAASTDSLNALGAKAKGENVSKLIEDPHPTVRRQAVRAIGMLNGHQFKTLIRGRTYDKDPMVRQEAAVQIGDQKILEYDVDLFRLFSDLHLYVRDSSLKSFVSFKNDSIVKLAGEGLVHKNAYTREYSSHALGLLKTNKHLKQQIELLKDPVQPVRKITAWALGEIGDVVANPALLACAKKHGDKKAPDFQEDWETSMNAIHAMGKLKYQEAAPWLREVFPQKFVLNYEVRRAAVWTVGQLKDKLSVPLLISRLSDINPMTGEGLSVRFEAAVAMGLIGDKSAVGALTSFMKRDEEPNCMKKACKWALEQILQQEVDYEIKEYPPSEKFYFINYIKPKTTEAPEE